MVVGSAAGINAALTAAQRGHAVDLYEEGPRLGGCVKMSSIFSPTTSATWTTSSRR